MAIVALPRSQSFDVGTRRGGCGERGSFNLIHREAMFKVNGFVLQNRPFDRVSWNVEKPRKSHWGPGARLLYARQGIAFWRSWRGAGEVGKRPDGGGALCWG
jgi:hypothetical protein